ncbi:serine/threonine-protein kinase polo [Brevipalpus obovatus]|uniref:serine/threonine-protein kinase polo n=1 Tax=Brevipalpus obovatus TaxID=246614 RepID=UPI003D9E46CB
MARQEVPYIIPDIVSDPTNRKKYQRGKFLGKGGFARCYELIELPSKTIFAGKVIAKAQIKNSDQKEKMSQEIHIHRSIKHKNIVNFFSYFEDTNNIYIVLELCSKRSLMEMHKRRKVFSEPEIRYMVRQIALACHYLHSNKIVHRDLKLGNLFLNEDMEVKVGDFGLATKIVADHDRKLTLCGTPNYIAPEVLMKKGHGFEVDVWSLGCIVYTLFVGKPPFETSELKDTYKRIRNNDYEIPAHVPQEAKLFIQQMLRANPKERPTMESILKDTYLTKNYIPSKLPQSCLTMAPRFTNGRLSIMPQEVVLSPRRPLVDKKQNNEQADKEPKPSNEPQNAAKRERNNNINNNNNNVNNRPNNRRRASVAFSNLRKGSVLVVLSFWTSFRGVFLSLLSALLFSITTVIVKFLTGVDPSLMALFRFVGITLFSFAAFDDITMDDVFAPPDCRRWVLLRGIVGATSNYLRYVTLHLLPLANATVITLSMPVFVCIFARIFLKEAFGIFHIVSLAVTLIGIGFTAKLDVIFGTALPGEDVSGIDRTTQLYGLACGMATTIIGSSSYILVRKVKHLHHSTILFNFAWVASIEMSMITFFMDGYELPECGIAPWLLMILAVLSFYAQMCLTRALQVEEAGIVSVTRSSGELFLAFIFQIFIFQKIPDLCTVLGAILITTAVLLTSLRKYIVTLPGDHFMRRWFAFTLK